MAYTDKLIEDFNKEDTVVETSTSTETAPSTVKEPETVEDLDKKAPAEDKPAEDKPADKPDLSQISKEAKAEHAFKRQLSKQREKHEAELKQMQDSFQKQFDELKKTVEANKAPEPVKTRADFPIGEGGDDAYIRYLSEQKVNKILAERDAKAAEESAKAEEERKAQQAREAENEAISRSFGENSHKAFPDKAEYDAYSAKVNKAIENGLGEILDTVPHIRDYIFKNPEGPVVLNKMLSDRESFVRVMSQTDPTMMIIAAHELARESVASAPVQTVVEEPHTVPHLGKPGARNTSSDAGSMFGSDKSLMAYVRSVNSRRR